MLLSMRLIYPRLDSVLRMQPLSSVFGVMTEYCRGVGIGRLLLSLISKSKSSGPPVLTCHNVPSIYQWEHLRSLNAIARLFSLTWRSQTMNATDVSSQWLYGKNTSHQQPRAPVPRYREPYVFPRSREEPHRLQQNDWASNTAHETITPSLSRPLHQQWPSTLTQPPSPVNITEAEKAPACRHHPPLCELDFSASAPFSRSLFIAHGCKSGLFSFLSMTVTFPYHLNEGSVEEVGTSE